MPDLNKTAPRRRFAVKVPEFKQGTSVILSTFTGDADWYRMSQFVHACSSRLLKGLYHSRRHPFDPPSICPGFGIWPETTVPLPLTPQPYSLPGISGFDFGAVRLKERSKKKYFGTGNQELKRFKDFI